MVDRWWKDLRRSCLDGDDDGDYDYALATCLERDGDDDGDYDYALAAFLKRDDDDRDYDYAPATSLDGDDDGDYDYASVALISSLKALGRDKFRIETTFLVKLTVV
ncbi:hypothetical protein H5410_059549 [Solanum commersonii]|uniref:Uncharacterized protein n=1 Tax=Solanum commersonii TaxID=4109 RepID=A0A9J5W325_SOLCO|nr:hypothetical protein H5410_059549 [Solanum commersonii]